MDNELMIKEFYTNGEEETTRFALDFAKTLKPGDILCLYGDLGVGKTVFTRGVCKALGTDDYINSPTFTIVNEYDAKDMKIFHFDMYRIEDSSELIEIGFDEYLSSGGVCIIEWPENISDELPKECIDIKIERVSFEEENLRRITVIGG